MGIGSLRGSDPLDVALRPAISTNLSDYQPNIWVTGSLAKVKPEGVPGSIHWAEISAARNEFENFQIHIRATGPPIQLDVSVSDFNGAGGRRIPADPNVQVFRESYSRIRQVSDLNGLAGWVPDALVPVRDSIFQERRNAFPIVVPAGQTRSAWIEVFVPPATASGYYLATATVKDGQKVLARVPIVLKVWDFELPSTASLRSAFGISGAVAVVAHNNPEPETANIAVAKFFLDHRITISNTIGRIVPRGDWTKFDRLFGSLLSGNTGMMLKGARITALQYPNYGTLDSGDVQDWVSHFREKGWLPVLFNYLCDEPPNGCSWDQLAQWSAAVRGVAPDLRNLVTVTIDLARQHGALENIDILTPALNDFFHRKHGDQGPLYDGWRKDPRKQLWWYQACYQHESCANGVSGPADSTSPSYMIDATPVRNRIFQWMAYVYRIAGEVYYETDRWGDDPWDHLYDFGGNGEGALVYPGTTVKIGGLHPTAVPSIRLKLIRDGMEDYEYLCALQRQGQGDFADRVSRTFIQNALTFNNNPEALMAAREQLGTKLHALALQKAR